MKSERDTKKKPKGGSGNQAVTQKFLLKEKDDQRGGNRESRC